MKVTFTKIHAKGYSVSAEADGVIVTTFNPAPGYHPRLPHDVAHFIVEKELQILGGVFGQIAARGAAKSPRKAKRLKAEIAAANKKDALFSEHAIYAAQSRWEKHDIIPDTKIPAETIQRIIAKFEDFATKWSVLPVGESVTLEWLNSPKAAHRRTR